MAGSVNKVIGDRLARLVHVDAESGCWEWQGCVQSNGYGRVRSAGKTEYAHRAAVGEIPSGADICHRCDNRRCINPLHLFAGSRRDNMRDAKAKGRLSVGLSHPVRRGEAANGAKLRWPEARAIRAAGRTGKRYADIAAEYGVSPSTVGLIVRERIWKEGRNA